MKEEKYVVVSGKPELVKLASGDVASVSSSHPPFSVSKDARFRRLRSKGKLKQVMVDVPDPAPSPDMEEPALEATIASPESGDSSASPEEGLGEEPELGLGESEDWLVEGDPVVRDADIRYWLIEDCDFKPSIEAGLNEAGIKYLLEADALSDDELLKLSGIGEKSVEDIRNMAKRVKSMFEDDSEANST